MKKLDRKSLMSLESYAEDRQAFRARVMAHKSSRRVALGPHATLYFEDALTIQYQVQEMLRVERIFEPAAIDEELDAYNPLIPDGQNWKATFMLEYPNVDERRERLAELTGVEHKVWVETGEERVFAHANDDLERSTDDKTAAVHFLRFELSGVMIEAVKSGADIRFGIDHPKLTQAVSVDPDTAASLRDDLN